MQKEDRAINKDKRDYAEELPTKFNPADDGAKTPLEICSLEWDATIRENRGSDSRSIKNWIINITSQLEISESVLQFKEDRETLIYDAHDWWLSQSNILFQPKDGIDFTWSFSHHKLQQMWQTNGPR